MFCLNTPARPAPLAAACYPLVPLDALIGLQRRCVDGMRQGISCSCGLRGARLHACSSCSTQLSCVVSSLAAPYVASLLASTRARHAYWCHNSMHVAWPCMAQGGPWTCEQGVGRIAPSTAPRDLFVFALLLLLRMLPAPQPTSQACRMPEVCWGRAAHAVGSTAC